MVHGIFSPVVVANSRIAVLFHSLKLLPLLQISDIIAYFQGFKIIFFFNAFCHWSDKNQTFPLCALIQEAVGIKDNIFAHADLLC